MVAEHFPKENVQHQQNVRIKCIFAPTKCDAKMHLMRTFCWCKNAFDAKMHFGNAKQNVTNAFDAKMHLMQKCIFATQRVHFPKENVQQNKMLQMHLMQKCI